MSPYKIKNPKSEIRNPKSEIRNPKSETDRCLIMVGNIHNYILKRCQSTFPSRAAYPPKLTALLQTTHRKQALW